MLHGRSPGLAKGARFLAILGELILLSVIVAAWCFPISPCTLLPSGRTHMVRKSHLIRMKVPFSNSTTFSNKFTHKIHIRQVLITSNNFGSGCINKWDEIVYSSKVYILVKEREIKTNRLFYLLSHICMVVITIKETKQSRKKFRKWETCRNVWEGYRESLPEKAIFG